MPEHFWNFSNVLKIIYKKFRSFCKWNWLHYYGSQSGAFGGEWFLLKFDLFLLYLAYVLHRRSNQVHNHSPRVVSVKRKNTLKSERIQKHIFWGELRQILEHGNWMIGLAALWLHNPLPCWMEHKKFVTEYRKMTTTAYLSFQLAPVVGLTLIWTVKWVVQLPYKSLNKRIHLLRSTILYTQLNNIQVTNEFV